MTEDIDNDSGYPTDEVLAFLEKEGVTISYGKLTMRVTRRALEEARQEVSTIDIEERREVMAKIERVLKRATPKILRGTASKKLCDDSCNDLKLWEALRASIIN